MIHHIYMRCPSCGYEWHGATIRPSLGETPEKACARPWCPRCEARPPMLVARVEPVGETVRQAS